MERDVTSSLEQLAMRHLTVRDGLPDAIARALREAILDGVLAPDARMHQDDIAQRFGVSRVPVREALTKLVTEGLAVQRFNKGIWVAPLSRVDFQDIMEMRLLLEPHALSMSALHLTRHDYELAEAVLDRVQVAETQSEAAALHWEFHNRLYAYAARPRLMGQISSLQIAINRYVLPIWRSIGLSPDWDDSHRSIVSALRIGNLAEAEHLTRTQIQSAMSRMMDHLPQADRSGDG